MLVVIGVIGILAAMIVGLAPLASNSRINARAEGEKQQLITAIEAYKAKKGFYPPSNPKDVTKPPLFYELRGTRKDNNGVYTTLDGQSSIGPNPAEIDNAYGVQGFVNSTEGGGSSDPDRPAAEVFHENIKATQMHALAGNSNAVYLGIPAVGPDDPDVLFTRWRYNSLNPTNNQGTYDLWIDLIVRGKIKTYGNWKQ
jgi:type II secretory pathway pseudopilin PulG